MKKNLFFMSILLAAGTLGFISCSSDNEIEAPVNPTFDGKSVKTQFAINVPAGVSRAARMSGEVVQDNFQFNGMKNIFLASLDNAPAADGSATYTAVFRLPSIVAQTSNENGIQKIYEDVSVPVDTKNFIFWAESAAEGNKNVTGVLKNNLNDNTVMTNSAVKFELEKIAPAGLANLSEAEFLVGKITSVTNVANPDGKTWRDIPEATDKAGEKVILRLMKAICKPDLRWNASYVAIYNILYDLQTGLSAITDEQLNDGTDGKPNTITLRTSIINAIGNEINNIKSIDKTFPENYGLPQGAIVMEYNPETEAFDVVNISSSTVLSGDAYLDVASLCYPASLNYFVSTDLRANDSKPTQWPSGVDNWIANSSWDNTWGPVVKETTQAIALKKNIQYSVARLDVNVKVATVTSLDDNSKNGTTPTPSKIPSNMFKVTGVAIGGQPVAADWQVLPSSNTEGSFANTIWDNQVTNTSTITESAQNFCKTLVLDNKVPGASAVQKEVVVAVEIENGSGTDFRGYNGVIKAGAKFYMIAKLDPTATTGVTQPTGEILDRVFVQDHNTVATFTIQNLKNAYIGVPDLRATDLQLGLSVDLKWEKGLEFNLDFQ